MKKCLTTLFALVVGCTLWAQAQTIASTPVADPATTRTTASTPVVDPVSTPTTDPALAPVRTPKTTPAPGAEQPVAVDSPDGELPVLPDSPGAELPVALSDSLLMAQFELANAQLALPDLSLGMAPWQTDFRHAPRWRPKNAPPPTPVILLRNPNAQTALVFDNNVLRLRRGNVGLSNGQAGNWSPYPDGYLDARTLSFPMPR